MTTRIVEIRPDTPTWAGESQVEYGMHCGWTMEVTNKDADYLTNDYPPLIRTGPASLIAEQAAYASSTYSVISSGPERPGINHVWYQGAHYVVANLNGVKYQLKWATSVTTPTQIKNILEAGGYGTT